jgi:glycolate oxidase iron-sulfur subunit
MREIEGQGLDAILTTTSGCGTMLKDYGHIFREHTRLAGPAKRIASLARDITEYVESISEKLSASGLPSAAEGNGAGERAVPRPIRVAYQSPCSMNHGQKIHALPMKLLSDAGYDVQPLPEAHVCCGSAGTYNLLQPQIATQLRKRKQALIEAQRPDVVATGNVGCMMQLSQDCGIPIVHTIELLDWATGGPKPRMANPT